MAFVLDTTQRQNVRLSHKVEQSARSANKNVASLLKLQTLSCYWASSIHDARPQHGSVAETTGFIEDLCRQLTGRRNDQYKWLTGHCVSCRVKPGSRVRTRGCELLGLSHELREHWNEKGGRLPRPYK